MHDLSARAVELGAADVIVTPPVAMHTDDQIAGWFAGAVGAVGPDRAMGAARSSGGDGCHYVFRRDSPGD